MELAVQIFIITGICLLIFTNIARFIEDKRRNKWIATNRDAQKIIIYIDNDEELKSAEELRRIIALFAKMYSRTRVLVKNSLVFDDDSSIDIERYCAEHDLKAAVYYYPKAYKNKITVSKDSVVYYY